MATADSVITPLFYVDGQETHTYIYTQIQTQR